MPGWSPVSAPPKRWRSPRQRQDSTASSVWARDDGEHLGRRGQALAQVGPRHALPRTGEQERVARVEDRAPRSPRLPGSPRRPGAGRPTGATRPPRRLPTWLAPPWPRCRQASVAPRTRQDHPSYASRTASASRPRVCRSRGPHASTTGLPRTGGGANAARRLSQPRAASLVRCSCATSQRPVSHHCPTWRMAGSSTSSIAVGIPSSSTARSRTATTALGSICSDAARRASTRSRAGPVAASTARTSRAASPARRPRAISSRISLTCCSASTE